MYSLKKLNGLNKGSLSFNWIQRWHTKQMFSLTTNEIHIEYKIISKWQLKQERTVQLIIIHQRIQ